MQGRNENERRIYTCWAIVEPAPDMKGKWVAHCLDFDTLAQADDAETAAHILIEMTRDVVREDLQEGKRPEERRAPDEDWFVIEQLVDAPTYGSFAELRETIDSLGERSRFVIACQFMLAFELRPNTEEPRTIFPLRAKKLRRSSSAEHAIAR